MAKGQLDLTRLFFRKSKSPSLSLSGKTKAFPLDFICFPVFSAPRQVWLQNFSRSAAGNKCWPGIFHPRNFHLAIFNVSNQLFPATVCLAFCHLAVGYLNILHAAENTGTYFVKNDLAFKWLVTYVSASSDFNSRNSFEFELTLNSS